MENDEDLLESISKCKVKPNGGESLDWIKMVQRLFKKCQRWMGWVTKVLRIGYPPDLVDRLDSIFVGLGIFNNMRKLLSRVTLEKTKVINNDRFALTTRNAKRHRKRMAQELAASWTGAVLEAAGPLWSKEPPSQTKLIMDDLEPVLKLKCDVSVVSSYEQCFHIVGAIFQSGNWQAADS